MVTHPIQLLAKMYGVDVVALKVGEHDRLSVHALSKHVFQR